jgi:hypothetical protein
LRTGAVCDRVVIDIDPRDGGRLDPVLMTPTAVVAAGGADGGWHLHYRHPGGYVPSRRLPGYPGIDVKGDGGYVVMPPSVHPVSGRPYRWIGASPGLPWVNELPPALAALVLAPGADAPPGPRTVHNHPATERLDARRGTCLAPDVAAALDAATAVIRARREAGTWRPGAGGSSSPERLLTACLEAIAAAPQGQRRPTLYGAARRVATIVAAGALDPDTARDALYAAGRAAEQTDRETSTAIAGAFSIEGVTR